MEEPAGHSAVGSLALALSLLRLAAAVQGQAAHALGSPTRATQPPPPRAPGTVVRGRA